MYTKSSNRVADSTLSNTNSNEYKNKNIKIQKKYKTKKNKYKKYYKYILNIEPKIKIENIKNEKIKSKINYIRIIRKSDNIKRNKNIFVT